MLTLYVCVWVKFIKFYTFYTQNYSIHRMCSHSAICFPDNILFKKKPRTLEAKSMSRAQQIPTQYSYLVLTWAIFHPPFLKITFYAILVWVCGGLCFKILSPSVYYVCACICLCMYMSVHVYVCVWMSVHVYVWACVCLCMYMSVYVYVTCIQMPTKPRRRILSSLAGVPGSCEHLTQCWDWTRVLWKSSKHP